MDKDLFKSHIDRNTKIIDNIRDAACKIHESVNQTYDGNRPYGYHLCMVADTAMDYGHDVVDDGKGILPMIFGAYFHDCIEDARMTYNDVMDIARTFMADDNARIATEIVYALTNEKGRTRQERAGEKYYEGIRTTPYAPFVKLCDRYANMSYSHSVAGDRGRRMFPIYKSEWPHFLASINVPDCDPRLRLPEALIKAVEAIIH